MITNVDPNVLMQKFLNDHLFQGVISHAWSTLARGALRNRGLLELGLSASEFKNLLTDLRELNSMSLLQVGMLNNVIEGSSAKELGFDDLNDYAEALLETELVQIQWNEQVEPAKKSIMEQITSKQKNGMRPIKE